MIFNKIWLNIFKFYFKHVSTSIDLNALSTSYHQKKIKRKLPSTPAELNSMETFSNINTNSMHASPYSSNLSISNGTANSLSSSNHNLDTISLINQKLDNLNEKIQSRTPDPPPPLLRLPTDSLINSTNNRKSPIDSQTPTSNASISSSVHKPKLENVTEWLNKSFDQSNVSHHESNTSKSTNQLFVPQKQQRSNSVTHVRVIPDEPIVEINLSKQFYLKKSHYQSQQQNLVDILPDNIERKHSLSSIKQPNKTTLYSTYSKSQSPLVNPESTRKSMQSNNKAPADILQKIFLYKDPIELNSYRRKSNDSNGDNSESPSSDDLNAYKNRGRRPSSSLGINIAGCQRMPDLGNETLAAVVSSIEPNGIVEKFNVEIKEGDEILEINGYNLRNKSDDQIEQIFDSTVHSNNGEIELLVRRSSLSSNHETHLYADDAKKSDYSNSSKQYLSETTMDDFQSTSSSDFHDIIDNNNRSITTPASEQSDSITSSPVSSEIMSLGHNAKFKKNFNNPNNRQNQAQQQIQHSSSSSSSCTSSVMLVNRQHRTSTAYNSCNETDFSDEFNSNRRGHMQRNGDIYYRKTIDRYSKNDESPTGEGRGFREISIKRKDCPPIHRRDTIMTDPAMILAYRNQFNMLRNQKSQAQQQSRSISPKPNRQALRAAPTEPSLVEPANEHKFMPIVQNQPNNARNHLSIENDARNGVNRASFSALNNKVNPSVKLDQFRAASPYYEQEKSDIKIQINSVPNSRSQRDLTVELSYNNLSNNQRHSIAPSVAYEPRRKASQETSSNDTGIGSVYDGNNMTSEQEYSRRLYYEANSSQSSRRNSKEETDSLFSYNSSNRSQTDQTIRKMSNPVNEGFFKNQAYLNLPDLNQSTGYNSNNYISTSPEESIMNKLMKKSPNEEIQKKSIELTPLSVETNGTNPFGDIQVQISHKEEEQQIVLKIIKARNLIAKDANGYSDPFVKVYLLPGRE